MTMPLAIITSQLIKMIFGDFNNYPSFDWLTSINTLLDVVNDAFQAFVDESSLLIAISQCTNWTKQSA